MTSSIPCIFSYTTYSSIELNRLAQQDTHTHTHIQPRTLDDLALSPDLRILWGCHPPAPPQNMKAWGQGYRRLYTIPPGVPVCQSISAQNSNLLTCYATILSISSVLNTVKSQTCTCYADNKFITQHTMCLRLLMAPPNNLHSLVKNYPAATNDCEQLWNLDKKKKANG